jgi:hypothetical protein
MVKDTDNTDRELSLDWVMEDNGRVEFLLLINVVVSELNLELNSLGEISLLLRGKSILNMFSNLGVAKFVHWFIKFFEIFINHG